jgi:hypothetical protein
MSLEDWKLCEGCHMFEPLYTCKDRNIPVFDGKQCPCINCLIKVTCEETCDNLTKYENKQMIWKKKYFKGSYGNTM